VLVHLSEIARIMKRIIRSLILLLGSTIVVSIGFAGHGGHCGRCGSVCDTHRLVKKTITVPCVVTETRMETCVVKKQVEREETYTVFKRVPVTRKFEKETCYLADEVKTQLIETKQCHQVQNPVIRTFAVDVPVTQTETVMRKREVCTECGKVCIEEPCSCQVTRMHRETQTEQYCEKDVVFETTKKEISYCVKTPKMHKEFCAEETTYVLEPVEQKRKVTVCVPEIIKKPVDVQVVKHLQKTIYCCEKCAKH
jgi:hypothetical protein